MYNINIELLLNFLIHLNKKCKYSSNVEFMHWALMTKNMSNSSLGIINLLKEW